MKSALYLVTFLLLGGWNQALAQQPAPKKPPVGVPPDAKAFYGKWYRVYLEKGSWRRAKERCTALGGQLAVVPDEETNTFIRELADSIILWLGATDEKVDGQWLWVDGAKMSFKSWDAGQPQGGRGEHYLCIVANGKWHDALDRNENFPSGFICEWKTR